MDRRTFLTIIPSMSSGVALTGCLGSKSSKSSPSSDSDGDGVPNKHDYAPRDKTVQTKNDAVGTATSRDRSNGTPTPKSTDTQEDKTDTPVNSTENSLPSNKITADFEPLSGRTSTFTEYSLSHSTVEILPQTTSTASEGDSVKVLTVVLPYPGSDNPSSEVYGYTLSDSFRLPSEKHRISAPVSVRTTPDTPFLIKSLLVPGKTTNETVKDVNSSNMESLCETDKLELKSDRLKKVPSSHELSGTEVEGYTREVGEGSYVLTFHGSTTLGTWDANMVIYKSSYEESKSLDRDRYGYTKYVQKAQDDGSAETIARILDEDAKANGYETKGERANFIIQFVQNLPYTSDDVSSGYDEYPRFVNETLAYGGGDCEDTSILLASILQAEPFNYDCVLINPPGHMSVGVYGEDLPGSYYTYNDRRYYYIETTGEDWDVGEIPPEYKDEKVKILDV